MGVVPVPQALDLLAADGKTVLNAFYLPPLKTGATPGQKHPVLTLAYGGPSGQTVAWRWSRSHAQLAYWQRRGFGVLMVDTRGMASRDRAFTRAHYRSVGQVEVDDLYAAVRQLPTLVPGVDPARIGFFGWSYGGFLAARVMLDDATPFAAAIGVAPVTDWTLYDTAYTERYLGLPKGPDGKPTAAYQQTDLTLRATALSKPLLLVHGTADDNVLFDHSLKLVEALQNEGKLFDLMIYPGKAHGISGRKTSLHLYRTMEAFLVRHLQP
jgi:dipeptidyl-peptidase-4